MGVSADGEKHFDSDSELKKFEECMDNDFDTSGAFGVVFELVKNVNTLRDEGKLNKGDVEEVEKFLREVDKVLGVIYVAKEESIDEDVEKLIKEREEARKNKDFEVKKINLSKSFWVD